MMTMIEGSTIFGGLVELQLINLNVEVGHK